MADASRPHPDNVSGDWFVDLRCIDCGTCRHLAPTVFGEFAAYSGVVKQPEGDEELRRSARAAICCPTGSIGTYSKAHQALVKETIHDFPYELAPDIFYTGFAAEESFGAASWLIRHPEGNWLIDSPRFVPHLVQAIEKLGGLKWIFLTHRDDVGEAEKFAAHFGAERIIHMAEKSAQPEAEHFITGKAAVPWGEDFTIIPVPGHTKGHIVLLYKNHLFSGDHIWWSRSGKRLAAGRSVCWYSWSEQTASAAKLIDYDFDWLMPGHGLWVQLPVDEMKVRLKDLVRWMEQT